MSNWFRLTADAPPAFGASNGATAVLLAVLVLAGSRLPATPAQARLVVWLASQDQSLIGSGVAGFALSELAWERESFATDKAFLLEAIATARTQHGWETLDYAPPPDRVGENLDQFEALVQALTPDDVAWTEDRTPILGWPTTITLCPIHQAYLHSEGCLICNDT